MNTECNRCKDEPPAAAFSIPSLPYLLLPISPLNCSDFPWHQTGKFSSRGPEEEGTNSKRTHVERQRWGFLRLLLIVSAQGTWSLKCTLRVMLHLAQNTKTLASIPIIETIIQLIHTEHQWVPDPELEISGPDSIFILGKA